MPIATFASGYVFKLRLILMCRINVFGYTLLSGHGMKLLFVICSQLLIMLMLFCSFFAEIDDTHITEEYKSLMSLADQSDGVTDIIINVCMIVYIIVPCNLACRPVNL